ncbi:MAG: T9SS type B sorting domain-containing protein [Bacteroidetes bacterium]|nr:T9SS type B sorting domain-containing protein [Bacteroidota bacterium]MBT6687622.1 T9SS type B sorting domain-containing protein [Bacteroidota bacterium]MBT7144745.1 T9SS type B sorting domain-containing protein [Bacteroidota bacterium]MBT7491767.1 T9SS type B sorting domain-containing protein [Bacteroidota bacterium]
MRYIKKMNFETEIREKLNQLELEYDHQEWLRLEKSLPAPKNISGIGKNAFLKTMLALIVPAIAVFSFYYFSENEKVENETSVEKIELSESKTYLSEDSETIPEKIVDIKNDKENLIQSEINTSLPVAKVESKNENKSTEKSNSQKELNSKTIEKANDSNQKNSSELKAVEEKINLVPNNNFSVNISEGCSPLTVTFSPREKSDTIFYLWNFGDKQISTEIEPVHVFTDAGSFDVSLTVTYFKSKNKESKNVLPNLINVKQSPCAAIELSENNNNYRFTTIAKNSCNYRWLIFSEEMSSDSEFEHTFVKDGKYFISLIAVAENACIDSVAKEVDVKIDHNILIPNAFTPDGDGYNDFFGAICNEKEKYEFEMKIFNKQGVLVFESKNIDSQWDGKMQGSNTDAKPGVYVWKILSIDKYNNVRTKMGNLNLMR